MPGSPKRKPKSPHHSGTIRTVKTKTGTKYYAEVMINSSMIYGPRVNSKSEAKPALQQKIRELAHKHRQSQNPQPLSTLAPSYLNGPIQRLRADNTNAIANYAWQALIPFLGHLHPQDVTPEILRAATDHLTVTNDTRNRYQREVAAMLKFFGNPIQPLRYPKSPEPEITILTRAQQQLLLAEATPWPRTYLAIWIMLETGIRPGEACGMKHEDVFEDGIWIKRSRTMVAGRPQTQNTKTEISKAWVPITPELLEQIGPPRTGYILALNNKPWRPDNLRRAIQALSERSGLGRVNPNWLRHTAAVNMLAAGVDPATVASITRHSMDVLLKLYYRSSNDLKRQALQRTKTYVNS